MKRNFDAPMIDLNNAPFKDGATLKMVCIGALHGVLPKDIEQKTDEKLACFQLMLKINAGGVQDVSAEELVLLKNRIGQSYDSLVVGRSFALLDADYQE